MTRFVLSVFLATCAVGGPSWSTERSAADADAIVVRALQRMEGVDLDDYPDAAAAVTRHINRRVGQSDFVDLVRRFKPAGVEPALLQTVLNPGDDSASVAAAKILLGSDQATLLSDVITGPNDEAAKRAMTVLGAEGGPRSIRLLRSVLTREDLDYARRSSAVRAMAASNLGRDAILGAAQSGQMAGDVKLLAGDLLARAEDPKVAARAAELLPVPTAADAVPLPPLDQLVATTGDINNGLLVFRGVGTCANCHQVDGFGKNVGPDLTEIGSKLSREAMYSSILAPSAGISHNYEMYSLLTEDGRVIAGLMVTQDDNAVTLRTAQGVDVEVPVDDVVELKKSEKSIMPENLHHAMGQKGLIDVVEYLITLKKKA